MQTHHTTEPIPSPATPDLNTLLFDISLQSIRIAALGRIIRTMSEERLTDDCVSDHLTRLDTLGACIDKLSQEITDRLGTYPLGRVKIDAEVAP